MKLMQAPPPLARLVPPPQLKRDPVPSLAVPMNAPTWYMQIPPSGRYTPHL